MIFYGVNFQAFKQSQGCRGLFWGKKRRWLEFVANSLEIRQLPDLVESETNYLNCQNSCKYLSHGKFCKSYASYRCLWSKWWDGHKLLHQTTSLKWSFSNPYQWNALIISSSNSVYFSLVGQTFFKWSKLTLWFFTLKNLHAVCYFWNKHFLYSLRTI